MVLSLEYNTIKCLNYLIEDAARNMKLFKEKVNKLKTDTLYSVWSFQSHAQEVQNIRF